MYRLSEKLLTSARFSDKDRRVGRRGSAPCQTDSPLHSIAAAEDIVERKTRGPRANHYNLRPVATEVGTDYATIRSAPSTNNSEAKRDSL